MADEKQTTAPQITFERSTDFANVYTNNVQVESTAWDVTVVFGQLDKNRGPNAVHQKVAVTMSWAEAKATCWLVLSNVAFFEALNGDVRMPIGTKPEPPSLDVSNPILKNVQERLQKIQALIFGER